MRDNAWAELTDKFRFFKETSFQGYVDAVKGLVKLGLLDPNPTPALHENGKN